MLPMKGRMNCSRNSIYNIFIFQKKRAKGGNHAGFLSSEELNEWLCASDIVLIQRKEILNSGNLPLAFSAGKIVVGPNKGNVGDILNSTNNPCFNPESLQDIIKKTKMGLKLSENSDIGIRNYEFAKKYMNPFTTNDIIANQLSRMISN